MFHGEFFSTLSLIIHVANAFIGFGFGFVEGDSKKEGGNFFLLN